MRLTCPKCDAQYEVADNVIPQEGRDVQCSNCGSTWFQESAKAQAAARRAAGLEDEFEEDVAEVLGADDDEDTGEATQDEGGDDIVPGTTVSKDSAQILREEAMRELKARLSEGPGLEQQEELGLDTLGRSASEDAAPDDEDPEPKAVEPIPEPVAVPTPRPVAAEGVSRDDDTSRAVAQVVPPSRDRLPDIEEINSTLTAASVSRENIAAGLDDAPQKDTRRTGFRIGFAAAVIVALVGAGAYIYAPALAQAAPGMAPMLAAFVEQTDGVRMVFNGWVSGTVNSLTGALDSATSGG